MTVEKIYSTTIGQPSGITEVLLEKAHKERDHYKAALEEIIVSIDSWADSMVKEPAEDFIYAIKAWADKKLKEI